jgi:hypothetical protein
VITGVAAHVRFIPECAADDVAEVADEAERRFRARHPGVREVFLDLTARPGDERVSGNEAGMS